MAAVDALIRLIAAQNADSLLLVSDQVPRLTRAGAAQPLSMPPVSAAMMETFVAEVLTPDQIEEARSVEALTVERGEFIATVKQQGAGWAMSFTRRPSGRGSVPPAPVASAGSRTQPRPRPPTPPHEAQPMSSRNGARTAATPAPALAPPALAAASTTAPAHADSAGEGGRELLDRWLRRAFAERATDLIVSAGHGARLRLPGGLVDLRGAALADAQITALVEPFLAESHHAALASHGSTDFAFVWRDPDSDGPERRLRVNLFRQGGGLAAVFRPVRRDPPVLSDLNLPESIARLARYPNGLVLITGPSGAGKSTTLVALIEQLGRELPRHIITLEDPIEYEYRADLALVHQREIGIHVDSFEAGLRAALRESPDVILLGEMRDRATIAAALTAAETGHLVLSSLHAGNAAMAVERVIDVFPEHQQTQVRMQLAGTLRAVLTQHLLPSSPGTRVPAIELMVANPAISSLIREGKTHQLASAIQTGRDDGMIPLDRSLADLVESGAVTFETALAVTLDGGLQLRELLGRGGSGTGRGRALR